MSFLKSLWSSIRDLFGFRKNTSYVRKHLNDANIKSSIYMSFIVLVIETWMILRRFYLVKYIPNNWNLYDDKFELIFKYTGQYILFFLCAATVFIFSISYIKKLFNKGMFITEIIVGSLCVLWFFLLFFEIGYKNITPGNFYFVSTILIYSIMPILGILIISHAFYQKKNLKNHNILANAIIVCFSLICLLFGMSVGYLDYTKAYMITCFLTMILFVACLLIWKPYISILMLCGIFVVFYLMLRNFDGKAPFDQLNGNEVNYITFFISLTMVTISIYQQRIAEAIKDAKLEHDAIYDNTLDIHNLKYFVDTISKHLKKDSNFLNDKIVLFTNISNFRIINAQKGFDAGNKFIEEFASNIIETFDNEIVARQADDHFVVLASLSDFETKINILKELVDKSANGLFVHLKVGGYKFNKISSIHRAIDKARYACGKIKRDYDKTFLEYDKAMDDFVNKRQYIVNNLDLAIENNWIQAYYQPVVWTESGELCGAEALARWIDPVYGFLSPADFIPLLEETRLIHKLDKCIIEYVCKKMREAIDNNRVIVPVSLNFSRLDFELMDVCDVLEEYVNKYNINKDYLHIEITESALSENFELLSKSIDRIKKSGYTVWLDDFGSGYSSLNVLKDYEFNVIKIDMKFLSNFEENSKSKDIIETIIELSNKLGMKTLTEGVETLKQAEYLKQIGCGRLQGYLFGKPFKLEDFEKKIENKEFIVSKEIL